MSIILHKPNYPGFDIVIQSQPAPSDLVSVWHTWRLHDKADRLHEPQAFWTQAGGSRKDGDGDDDSDGDGDDFSMRAARNEELRFPSHGCHEAREIWEVMAQWKFRSGRRELNCSPTGGGTRTEGVEFHDGCRGPAAFGRWSREKKGANECCSSTGFAKGTYDVRIQLTKARFVWPSRPSSGSRLGLLTTLRLTHALIPIKACSASWYGLSTSPPSGFTIDAILLPRGSHVRIFGGIGSAITSTTPLGKLDVDAAATHKRQNEFFSNPQLSSHYHNMEELLTSSRRPAFRMEAGHPGFESHSSK